MEKWWNSSGIKLGVSHGERVLGRSRLNPFRSLTKALSEERDVLMALAETERLRSPTAPRH